MDTDAACLCSFVQKGLQYIEIESHFNDDGVSFSFGVWRGSFIAVTLGWVPTGNEVKCEENLSLLGLRILRPDR